MSERSAAELAELFHEIADDLGSATDGNEALDRLVDVAAARIDGAEYAGVTVGRETQRFATIAATHELVRQVDQLQYELGSGPCVDAIVAEQTYNAADLRTDDRWPEFGRRCVDQTGIVSMLSNRLFVESDPQLIAGLNVYSHQPNAFDAESEIVAGLIATHAAVAVGKAAAEDQSRNLMRALENSREIGMAMGILMWSQKVTRDQAFDLLRIASQHSHRKLADIAAEVTDTGALPERTGGPRQR